MMHRKRANRVTQSSISAAEGVGRKLNLSLWGVKTLGRRLKRACLVAEQQKTVTEEEQNNSSLKKVERSESKKLGKW